MATSLAKEKSVSHNPTLSVFEEASRNGKKSWDADTQPRATSMFELKPENTSAGSENAQRLHNVSHRPRPPCNVLKFQTQSANQLQPPKAALLNGSHHVAASELMSKITQVQDVHQICRVYPPKIVPNSVLRVQTEQNTAPVHW